MLLLATLVSRPFDVPFLLCLIVMEENRCLHLKKHSAKRALIVSCICLLVAIHSCAIGHHILLLIQMQKSNWGGYLHMIHAIYFQSYFELLFVVGGSIPWCIVTSKVTM